MEQLPSLPTEDVLAALRSAFTELAAGTAIQPPQTVTLLPGGGDVIAYQAATSEAYAAKLSPYLPQPDGSAIVAAWTVVLSTRTGRPVVLCDSKALTVERTAATTALAVDLLAKSDASTLALIGAGAQAHAHLRYARAVRSFADVRIYSRSLREAPDGTTLTASADEAAAGADVVLLCTSAGEAVIDVTALDAGTLVTSISTNVPRAHEIAPAALPDLDVYGDYRPTVTASAGEMVIAAEQGIWSPKQLRGDLPELLTGACERPSGDRPVFFRSIGLGIEDLAVTRLLVPSS
ncbi:NAD(P)H-dependent anabolic L-arginine dehydrogenase DauB [Kribbella aluminosa]